MKKGIIIFVFLFPLTIFLILNVFASAIAMFMPITVERVEFHEEKVVLKPLDIYKLKYSVFPERAQNQEVRFYIEGEGAVTIDETGTVTVHDYGYAHITIQTIDGNYTDSCVVEVFDPLDDGSQIRAIYLSYKEAIHSDYQFGITNGVKVEVKYFPETAINDLTYKLTSHINGTVLNNGKNLTLLFQSLGENTLTVTSQKTKASKSFVFHVNEGVNVSQSTEMSLIHEYLSGYQSLYLVEDFHATESITLRCNPVTRERVQIFGNGWKWNHSNMSEYLDKNLTDLNVRAISLTPNTGLENLRVVGKVSEQNLLYDRVVNVGVVGLNNFDGKDLAPYLIDTYDIDQMSSDGIDIKKCIIENGRYNLSFYGGYKTSITDCVFQGAVISSLQVNNPDNVPGSLVVSTQVDICDITIRLAKVGVLIENNEARNDRVKGCSIVRVLPSKGARPSIVSDNWRNLAEAYSVSPSTSYNLDSVLNRFLDMYPQCVKTMGDYQYVNCLFVVMGGKPNYSQVLILDQGLLDSIEKITYKPSSTETIYLGGKNEFNLYMLKK